ncbi:hypothetical protein KKJ17_01945 [Xenorhabdus bovienii]|uniref:Uncharacterized protein n=1 Tax=Xenorhabdus bovienii str. oregonense TaxID=1398202 RepID=A0A077P2G1_XENBV|nr:hypothetical protein [Xenorhabdus bovienii]MDE9516535.1 hypothetical protein [Xenorhabdus bovienii]CDG87326.1 conserved hypothetical protein [Xenorhabdus bovienii str. feltiae France]CDG94015.1 conserved hypothetical protein [Xenorhabdus bovienii str. feltiae Florida]CDH04883.1 conserved hypothetical protein [Xenorhabdus bovienii str. oregonense]
MEISRNKIWESKEWEHHVNDLLRIKFGDANYIPIPDGHNGDAGIEGYCTKSYAFQSYCPDEACPVKELYEKQRDKITTDIAKFIKNKDNYLKQILQNTKIKRWILVVPRHISKHLVVHASNKETEVIKADLPYVDNTDFKILIWDRELLKQEESELISKGLRVLKVEMPDIDESQIEEIKDSESEFVNNISRKLLKLKNDETQVTDATNYLLQNIVMYKNIMSDLKENYPSLHEEITNGVLDRESDLKLDFFDSDILPPAKQVELLNKQLTASSKLHRDNLKCISTGVVGDWLMRCNLDF